MREKLRKNAPNGFPIGESWEISGWGNHQTAVSDGEFKGITLGELFARDPAGLIGAGGQTKNSFPLLFKFIDAQENLSIQVHPNSEQARTHGWGTRGKTEVWYVVDAEPGAQIALGFNRNDISREEAAAAVRDGSFETLLNVVPVERGDTFFIPAGTVHAIMRGVLIYEVQEESNITLRLYDWNRKGLSGDSRTLHVDDALDIIKFTESRPLKPDPVTIEQNDTFIYEQLCYCSKFALNRYRFSKSGAANLSVVDGFRVLTVTSGSAMVYAGGVCIPLDLGQTILIPALPEETRIEGINEADVLITMADNS